MLKRLKVSDTNDWKHLSCGTVNKFILNKLIFMLASQYIEVEEFLAIFMGRTHIAKNASKWPWKPLYIDKLTWT